MNKFTKFIVIIAIVFIITGCSLFMITLVSNNLDLSKINNHKYRLETYEINDSFENIYIDTLNIDIKFIFSEEEKVVINEQERLDHFVYVEENALKIEVNDQRKFYDFINIFSPNREILIYLNKTNFQNLNIKDSTGDIIISKDFSFKDVNIYSSTGDVSFFGKTSENLKIRLSTGDINVENVNANIIDLTVSTGDINLNEINSNANVLINSSTGDIFLKNVKCNNIDSYGSTGDIFLINVIANNKFNLQLSTGTISFNDCDASEIYMSTSTGDIIGTLLSEKIFDVEVDTGDFDVPKTYNGGICKIVTNTGDVKISYVK